MYGNLPYIGVVFIFAEIFKIPDFGKQNAMQVSEPDAPIVLLEGEYLYLNNRLEPMSAADLDGGAAARFVVQRKEDTLRRLVQCVLQTELSAEERRIAELLLLQGESVSAAARSCGITRGRAQTLSEKADSKLRAYLKYPFLMDFSLVNPTKPFLETVKQYGGVQ